MVRYSSVQTYSDQNTRVIPQQSSALPSSAGSGGVGSNGASGDGKKLQVERVLNVQGSCRGAGSGEFHTYRHARRRELTRLEEIEKQQTEEVKERDFLLRVAQKKIETELRTQKNVEKRKRQKEKKLSRKRKYLESHPEAVGQQKHGRKSEESESDEEDSEGGEEGEGKEELGRSVEEEGEEKKTEDKLEEEACSLPVSTTETMAPERNGTIE